MDDSSSLGSDVMTPEPSIATHVATNTAVAPWWRSPALLISALAFILSLGTTIISIYTSYIKDIHDRQKRLSDVVEKLLQLPLAEVSIYSSYPNQKVTDVGAVFSDQRRMLTIQAYGLTRSLGANAPAPELMVVGQHLVAGENYAAAKQVFKQAADVADNFSDEVNSLRTLGNALIRYAQNDRDRGEGERSYERAMDVGSKYPDVARDPTEISYTNMLTQLSWTQVWSDFDCNKAGFHLEQADRFSRTTGVWWSGDPDIAAWREALKHCDEHNRLPPRFYPSVGPHSVTSTVVPTSQPLDQGSSQTRAPPMTTPIPSTLSGRSATPR